MWGYCTSPTGRVESPRGTPRCSGRAVRAMWPVTIPLPQLPEEHTRPGPSPQGQDEFNPVHSQTHLAPCLAWDHLGCWHLASLCLSPASCSRTAWPRCLMSLGPCHPRGRPDARPWRLACLAQPRLWQRLTGNQWINASLLLHSLVFFPASNI